MEEVLPELLERQVTVFSLGSKQTSPGMHGFIDKMRNVSSEPLAQDLRSHLNMHSLAFYVYTSGTTGEPNQIGDVPRAETALSLLIISSSVEQVSRRQL